MATGIVLTIIGLAIMFRAGQIRDLLVSTGTG